MLIFITEIEKLHGVKFMPGGTHENDKGFLFIHFAAKALYERQVKDKVKRADFVTVLADGATDAACIEKEVIYILFVDPDDFKASLAFLSLKSVKSQDAQGITGAIIDAFKECGIEEKLQRIVFLCLMVLQLTQVCELVSFPYCSKSLASTSSSFGA